MSRMFSGYFFHPMLQSSGSLRSPKLHHCTSPAGFNLEFKYVSSTCRENMQEDPPLPCCRGWFIPLRHATISYHHMIPFAPYCHPVLCLRRTSPRILIVMLRTTRLLTMMFVGTPWGSHRWAQAFAPVPPMRDPTIHRSSHRAKSCIPAVETTGSPAERFSRRSLEARAMAERPNARHRRPSCLYALGVGGAHGMSLRTTSLGSLSCAFSMYGSSSHWRRRDSVRRVALSWIRARSLPTLREAESPGDPSPGEGYEIPRSSRKMESGEGAMLPGVDEDEEVNGETSGDMEVSVPYPGFSPRPTPRVARMTRAETTRRAEGADGCPSPFPVTIVMPSQGGTLYR